MNLHLLSRLDGQWVYEAPEQTLVAEVARTKLGWDLYAFDCWVYDSRNWSMYTRERQRHIQLRQELSLHAMRHAHEGERLIHCVALHCIDTWHNARSSKVAPAELLASLKSAHRCAHALALRIESPGLLRAPRNASRSSPLLSRARSTRQATAAHFAAMDRTPILTTPLRPSA
jgi:hypothetical protein